MYSSVNTIWVLLGAALITVVFLVLKKTIGLRVSAEEELKGLDITEHGLSSAPVGGVKMTRIDILCKMERFEALKRAMFDIGITGMTAANVMGCGEQRGKTEGYFRGAKVEATMLPNMQVSIVVSKVPVSLVVNTARKALYTGNIGDGKIFISNVENVVKVRTGEQGYDALQDEEQHD